ncbi:uncharacterized protein [Nicotiana tomentosiformis]|uniref:uncharacterized protein n=1 Tax=Nicotiana tomentosiformis TaxID=4098 RepID=UPI00388C43D1
MRVDLFLLSMIDFDVILGMDWFFPNHAILDFHAVIMAFAMPRVLRLEWRGSLDYVSSREISHLKAQRMAEKGYLEYVVFVRDVSADTSTVESVLVVTDFPDMFPVDPSSMTFDRNTDFGIDRVPGTQPISIPPYYLALVKLKGTKGTITWVT